MDTQQIVTPPINHEIYGAAELACMTMMELSPAGKELFAKRTELLAAIEGKVTREIYSQIEDLFMRFACDYGHELFRLGLGIGRDPALLFDLPDAE